MELKIEILREDILNGVDNEESSCPIALAVKRVLSFSNLPYHTIRVNGLGIIIERPEIGQRYLFDIPLKAIKFIDRFDAGKTVFPFSFILKKEGLIWEGQ